MNAGTAGPVGMPQLKQLNMENIDMWRHPKYYKELRKAGNELAQASAVKEDLTGSSSSPARNKSDRAISLEDSTESVCGVRPGPGHKLQAREDSTAKRVAEPQASSNKPQATKTQASESKTQAPSCEVQASSHKHQAP
jgi:hypothetical protein